MSPVWQQLISSHGRLSPTPYVKQFAVGKMHSPFAPIQHFIASFQQHCFVSSHEDPDGQQEPSEQMAVEQDVSLVHVNPFPPHIQGVVATLHFLHWSLLEHPVGVDGVEVPPSHPPAEHVAVEQFISVVHILGPIPPHRPPIQDLHCPSSEHSPPDIGLQVPVAESHAYPQQHGAVASHFEGLLQDTQTCAVSLKPQPIGQSIHEVPEKSLHGLHSPFIQPYPLQHICSASHFP